MNKSILLFLFFLVAISSVGKAQEDVSYEANSNYTYLYHDKLSGSYKPFSYVYGTVSITAETTFNVSDGKIYLKTGGDSNEITKEEDLDESKYTVLAPAEDDEWLMWEELAKTGGEPKSYVTVKDGDNIFNVINSNKDKFANILNNEPRTNLGFGKLARINQIRFQKNPVYMIKNKESERMVCNWNDDEYIEVETGGKVEDYLSQLNLGSIPNGGYTTPESNADNYYLFAMPTHWSNAYFWKKYKKLFPTLAVEVTPETVIDDNLLAQVGLSEEGCQIGIGRYIEHGQWTIPIHYGEGDEEAFTF
ncbi:MAG: hypothetical protein HUJ96_04080, partial [Marinilabiliaceae bacterium]|nr:hypothetical protein [Marinilabiliaceae bacterium]